MYKKLMTFIEAKFKNSGKTIKAIIPIWSLFISLFLLLGFAFYLIEFKPNIWQIVFAWALICVIDSFVFLILLVFYGFGEIVDNATAVRQSSPTDVPSDCNDTDAERIDKLNKLLADGLITSDEYSQAISKIE